MNMYFLQRVMLLNIIVIEVSEKQQQKNLFKIQQLQERDLYYDLT